MWRLWPVGDEEEKAEEREPRHRWQPEERNPVQAVRCLTLALLFSCVLCAALPLGTYRWWQARASQETDGVQVLQEETGLTPTPAPAASPTPAAAVRPTVYRFLIDVTTVTTTTGNGIVTTTTTSPAGVTVVTATIPAAP